MNTDKLKQNLFKLKDLFLEETEENKKMLDIGKKKNQSLKNTTWHINNAEKLKFKRNYFDYYTISFGLRNTKNINKSLNEAYKVLKPGGRFLCLEFSKVENDNLKLFYKKYSKLIPVIGEFVVGEKEPYEYLIESIEKFLNQDELLHCMNKNGFKNCSYRNLEVFNYGAVVLNPFIKPMLKSTIHFTAKNPNHTTETVRCHKTLILFVIKISNMYIN